MPYLIDGHNLIPKLGLRLDSPDDEMELVAILQEFCRLERRQAEVYFDGAPRASTRRLGAVTAHFVPRTTNADNAIHNRVKKMGKSAKNWTVVSSDRQVQAESRAAQADIMSSDSFAMLLRQARDTGSKPTEDRKLSRQEVDEWLKVFEQRKHKP